MSKSLAVVATGAGIYVLLLVVLGAPTPASAAICAPCEATWGMCDECNALYSSSQACVKRSMCDCCLKQDEYCQGGGGGKPRPKPSAKLRFDFQSRGWKVADMSVIEIESLASRYPDSTPALSSAELSHAIIAQPVSDCASKTPYLIY